MRLAALLGVVVAAAAAVMSATVPVTPATPTVGLEADRAVAAVPATPTVAVSATPATPTVRLEEAFADRAVVEAVVDCFIDNATCTPEQDKIRERAMATMQNMGRCPENLCTEQEQLEMTRAMELLQRQHRDLWIKLLIAMFDLQLPV